MATFIEKTGIAGSFTDKVVQPSLVVVYYDSAEFTYDDIRLVYDDEGVDMGSWIDKTSQINTFNDKYTESGQWSDKAQGDLNIFTDKQSTL